MSLRVKILIVAATNIPKGSNIFPKDLLFTDIPKESNLLSQQFQRFVIPSGREEENNKEYAGSIDQTALTLKRPINERDEVNFEKLII